MDGAKRAQLLKIQPRGRSSSSFYSKSAHHTLHFFTSSVSHIYCTATTGLPAAPVQPAMELILHSHGMLPRPTQRSFARSYLLHHHTDPINTRLHRNHRVFPEFSPAETSHLFTAAAAASAATALSLEALKASIFKAATSGENNQDSDTSETTTSLPQPPPPPSTIEEIWTAAWQGLEDNLIEEGVESSSTSAPITTPLLWLQGLRGDARRRLLSLSLAALESAINNKILDTTATTSVDSICSSILKESSAAAANAWLGYIPSALEHAIQLPTEKYTDTNSTSGSKEKMKKSQLESDLGSSSSLVVVDWYAVEERIPVYYSVIRLLQSTNIITAPSSSSSWEELHDEEDTKEEKTSSESRSLRTVAEASLLSKNNNKNSITTTFTSNSNSTSINGWTATQGGATSQSQLFSLAPSVLQDMAIRVADVVAAAYLEEAAQGTWTPSSANSLQPGSSTSFSKNKNNNKRAAPTTRGVGVDVEFTVPTTTTALVTKPSEGLQQPLDSNLSSTTTTSLESSWWPVFAHPRLASTRQLQRFSNRLLLSRWIDSTFHSVVAAYDDRLPLFTLCAPGGLLRVRQAPVRRAAELSALTGIRYYVSLILEAVDAAAPTLKMLWERATAAVAWLLTYGLGKGIGLVWKGLKIGVSSAAANSTSNSSTATTTTARKAEKLRMKRAAMQDSADDIGSSGSLTLAGSG
jgi:hypothetical protein